MKTCTQCDQEFEIFDEDREFYRKINVPEPTWCPECRNMRRCAYRNERVLYMRSCDLCKKSTLSTYHTDPPTIEWSAVPDDIKDASDGIIKNIFACQKCRKNYRIIKQEFAFYKAKTIPLPRLCPDCRFYERFSHRNPRTLRHRQCMCDRAEHDHRSVVAPELQQRRTEAGQCSTTFETPYAPDRKERIYCGACYEQEVG